MSVGKAILLAWMSAGRKVVPFVGLGWLTLVFYGGAVVFLLEKLSAAMLAGPHPEAGSFNDFALFYLFCLVVVTAFANAVIGLPMTREALQPGGEWKTAYFSIARQEWGLFTNLLLLYVIVIGLVAAIMFAGNVGVAVSLPMIGNGGVWNGITLAPLMSGTIAVVAIAVGLFLATRFGFFLAAIAAAEPPARLLQAWMLSRRNFWRLLVISSGLFIPLAILMLLAGWAVLGSEFGDALAATPRDVTPLIHLIQGNTGLIASVFAIGLLIWNAIFASASADAYVHVGGNVTSITSHEFISFSEPAPAMATAAPPTAAADNVSRVEPAFAPTEETQPVAKSRELPATETMPVIEPVVTEGAPEAEEEQEKPSHELPEAASSKDHQTEEIEFKTVEDRPVPAEPAMIAASTIEEHSEIAASAEMHDEALAPQEPPHEMNPLDHAISATPDQVGAAATPLPSFVEAHSSPEHEPSEAA